MKRLDRLAERRARAYFQASIEEVAIPEVPGLLRTPPRAARRLGQIVGELAAYAGVLAAALALIGLLAGGVRAASPLGEAVTRYVAEKTYERYLPSAQAIEAALRGYFQRRTMQ
jgi:hypothetical protein